MSEESGEEGEGPVRRMGDWSLKAGSGVDLFGLVRDGLLPCALSRVLRRTSQLSDVLIPLNCLLQWNQNEKLSKHPFVSVSFGIPLPNLAGIRS